MAILTQEEIEQKKELIKEKLDEMRAIYAELSDAGAYPLDYPLDDDELDGVAGGKRGSTMSFRSFLYKEGIVTEGLPFT